jgi:tetrapyrrole methylase family protein/MazG family protein
MRDAAAEALRRLNEVVERLRAPGGCPWDREQTHRSLRPYLLEETHEVLDAIDEEDLPRLREELGDVLLQVLMHAAIAQESPAGFDIGDVADATTAKMIHRHPHVFGEATVEGAADVVVNWERLKRSENSDRLSVLDGVPRALPALAFAQGVQKRPARIGFDRTPSAAAARSAVGTALGRLDALTSTVADARRGEDWTIDETRGRALEEAVGELLFAIVALTRRLRINPEEALRTTSLRFARRFRELEGRALAENVDLHDVDTAEWERRWGEVGGR